MTGHVIPFQEVFIASQSQKSDCGSMRVLQDSTWGQPLAAISREDICASIMKESCGIGFIRSFRILQQHATLDKFYLYSPYITAPGLGIISKSFSGLELSILIWIE